MQNGVYTSVDNELILSEKAALLFYSNEDNSVFGAKLYFGDTDEKKLIAICERNTGTNYTGYAFINTQNNSLGNNEYFKRILGEPFILRESFYYKKLDDIEIVAVNTPMPSVTEAGIENCLKLWKLGNSLQIFDDSIQFMMNTSKFEYAFMIHSINDDIYCGASVTIPFDSGLLGGRQRFRIRNYKDNSKPFCAFYCNLNDDIVIPVFDKSECKIGQCNRTSQGIIFIVKRYTDDEITLNGCNGDEYSYYRYAYMTERFTFTNKL